MSRYEEKDVKVGRKKKNVMLIGEGMGKTIIRGKRNVMDGITTFHTASFGKSPPFSLSLSDALYVYVYVYVYRMLPVVHHNMHACMPIEESCVNPPKHGVVP